MWISEISNVVIENRNKNTFYAKSLWAHGNMNISILFVERHEWGAIELTSEQYELIEETSYQTDTYDTQYSTPSYYHIKIFKELLFTDGRNLIGTEFCKKTIPPKKYTKPDDNTLEAMSDLSWFEVNYGVNKGNITNLYKSLLENKWVLNQKTFSVHGDINVMKKSDYDYSWINDDISNEAGKEIDKYLYGLRISFLNNQEKV